VVSGGSTVVVDKEGPVSAARKLCNDPSARVFRRRYEEQISVQIVSA